MAVVMETRELRAVGAGERRDRDRELVRLIGRHGAMTMEQLMRATGAGRTATYRRFARCEEAGLVERLRIPGSGPAVLHATREGLRYAGLGLPVAAISPGSVDHMLRCSEIALALERRHPDRQLLTEREIAFAEQLEGRPIASVEIGRVNRRPRYHRADLVILMDCGAVPFEVELTPKAPARLRAIVAAWRRAPHIHHVEYLCEPGQTYRAVERAVAKVGAGDKIVIAKAVPR
jgi:DNA-binding Lrp family transcriptional regulator